MNFRAAAAKAGRNATGMRLRADSTVMTRPAARFFGDEIEADNEPVSNMRR